ncbi:DNA polymerase III subunit delta [Rehaibacterium terrae]|uniref:DNA polymerase III subunit delta n=1 Tax=Rehaibacterium terrae TaxID=1341696 RepID=UPI00391D94C5
MELRPDRFEAQLAREPLRPVYLIAGGEPLLVQECADAVRAKAREEGYGEREVFDAEGGFDWNTLTQGLGSLSLFATRRLFDLRLPGGKPGKEGSEVLREYCAHPPPDTVLLITCQDWSRQHAGKWSEAIAATGHFVPVWPLKPHELPEWLLRRLRQRGLQAAPEAIDVLVERVEGNLLAAAQEIDKLALLHPGANLDAEAMARAVADSARFDVFRLMDATLAGEPARVVRMLHVLRAEGEQVPALMGWVAGELQRIAGFAAVQDAGGNVAAAMKDARLWDSRQAAYRRAMQRHAAARWEHFVAECGRIDRMAKGREKGDPWLALERLLVAVAEPKARGLVA